MNRLLATAFATIALGYTLYTPACAAIIYRDIKFSATGFSDVFATGTASPIVSISGEFKIRLDDTLPVKEDTTDLQLVSLSFPQNSTLGFDYFPRNSLIIVGGIENHVSSVASNTRDFYIAFNFPEKSTPTFQYLDFAFDPSPTIFESITGEIISKNLLPSAVPEPATWTMMIAGFGLVGLASRGGRALVTTPAAPAIGRI